MSTDAVVKAVRDAGEAGSAVRIAGRGSWLDAGRPVQADRTLSLRDDTGVVSYVPGDLTLTVRAGTTLAEIERVTAENDQWLPLDPYGNADGTIGATISTASAGPLATNFGLPRDLVLGLEFVTGRGDVVRSGGKVVKNVAGFDLTRLITGSWGTLGVVTEVTLRLYARPKVDRTFVVVLPTGSTEIASFLRGITEAHLRPFAVELLSPNVARSIGISRASCCVVRFGGNAPAVEMQIKTLSGLAKADEAETGVWDRLRYLEHDAEGVIRVSGLPSRFQLASSGILHSPHEQLSAYVSPLRGMLRLVIRTNGSADSVGGEDAVISASTPSGSVVMEKLPPETWNDIPSDVADSLSRGMKKAYDPHNILNPGILGQS